MEKIFTTKDTIITFIIIVAVFGIFFGIALFISSYPGKRFINKMHKNPFKDMDTYYFYYQKATAYRMLFLIHTAFDTTFKILGSTMTFITVYCAIDNNEYILLFSMIAAMCQTVGLIIPTGKYIKIYVEAARILEYALNTQYKNEDINKQKLNEAYQRAEEIIKNDFV